VKTVSKSIRGFGNFIGILGLIIAMVGVASGHLTAAFGGSILALVGLTIRNWSRWEKTASLT
jgi:hypothetical protein